MKPSHDEPIPFADTYRFGEVCIDAGRQTLQVGGRAVEIEPKPLALLIALADARGEVLAKRDLLDRLWPRQIVTDAVLNQCVLRARQAIGDDEHRLIVTVHRRGYRLGPEVEVSTTAPSPMVDAAAVPASSTKAPLVRPAIALLGVVALLAFGWLLFGRMRDAPEPSTPSVAVMPIETDSQQTDVQRIASGLSDALLTRLAQDSSLRVPARTSVRMAAEHRSDVRRIGRELGVGHVFEAVLSDDGKGYVVHASLVRSRDGFQEWARQFDIAEGGLAAAEVTISDAVIRALDPQGSESAAPTQPIGTDSDQAYRAYLRGRALWHQRTEAALRWAIENDESALQIDPQFARAHADLATAWTLLYEYSNLSLDDAREAAEPHLQAALQIAPNLAEAHAAMGLLQLNLGDAVAAEKSLRTAIAAAPNDATFQMWLGTALSYQGRVREATLWHAKALALDPLSAIAHVYVGVDHALAGDAHAQTEFERAIALDPRLLESYWQYALSERFQHRAGVARTLLERAFAIDTSSEYTRALLADTLLEAGAPADAEAVLRGGSDGSLAAWLRSAAAVAIATGHADRAQAFHRLSVDRAAPLPDDRLLAASAQAHLGHRTESLALFDRLIADSGGNEPIVRLWQADLGAPDLLLYLDLVREQRGADAEQAAASAATNRLKAMQQGGVHLAALDALLAAVGGRASQTSAAIRIVATERGFEAPSRISAGLRHIVFENHGSSVHEAMLVKLPPGMDADAYAQSVKGGQLFPAGALDHSGPGLTIPGESVEVWVHADAGDYVLICWNGDHPSTVPLHRFSVVDDGVADDVAPKEDAVLKMVDFRFELAGTLKQGSQVIRVETPGPSMHEVDIFRLRGSSTVADLNRWRKAEDAGHTPEGSSPADAIGGLLDSHDIHHVAWLRRTFAPGRYVFFCEMPMQGADGVSHADVGMAKEFTIAP